MSDIIVYDMEVFKYDWFLTARSIRTTQYAKIHNDYESLSNFYNQHKLDIWAGHNNSRYDDVIIKCLLNNIDCEEVKAISDDIIHNENSNSKIIKKYKLDNITLYSIDLMQDALRYSLKEIEGYLGLSIEESDIPFDIKRPLTNDEVKEVFKYNQHDVDATFKEFEIKSGTWMNKIEVIKEYNLPMTMLGYTNAKLSAEILKANYTKFDDGLQPYDLSIAPISINKYKECIDFYTKIKEIDYSKKLKINIANVPHIVSYGGIHGALEHYVYEGEIWLIDVSSYYPNMMINFNLCSRAMSHPENFTELVANRMKVKKQLNEYKEQYEVEKDKDKKEQLKQLILQYALKSDALKLPINTVSGCMKAKFNKLFDERNNNWMCITGQLLLIDLIESMEPYMTLIQSNTDGIMIIPNDKDKCDEKIKEWEDKTGLILEKTIATKLYQKDVNNYILLDETGKVKTRGGYVTQYHNLEYRFKVLLRRNDEIVDEAVVDYLLYNKPIEETIMNDENELAKYQIIKKLGGMYDDIVLYKYDDEGSLIEDRNVNRVNRVFATSDKHYGKLMKKHNKKSKHDSVEGTPDRCLVLNKDIDKMKAGDVLLDYNWYINEAKERIIDFILTTKEKKELSKDNLDLWLSTIIKLGRM